MSNTIELTDSLEVDSLLIEMTTNRTPDPYGQDGFSDLRAQGRTSDVAVIRRAEDLKASQNVLTVTCGKLRVKGILSAVTLSESAGNWVLHISVDEINYRKSTGPSITWKRA